MVATPTALPDPDDTIVALASASGPGLRAIVRISGRCASAAAAAVFPGFTREPKRRLVSGAVRLPEARVTLPTDLYWFPSPRSYTGQDVVELHTLSFPPLVEPLAA